MGGGWGWNPCLGGRDLADGTTLYFRFHGPMVADFCLDVASGFQFSGGYPPLAGSKCLGPGVLRRPAGVDWLWLLVVLRYPECFGYVCTPLPPFSAQFSACCDSRAVPPPPPLFPLGRRRGLQLPPCL